MAKPLLFLTASPEFYQFFQCFRDLLKGDLIVVEHKKTIVIDGAYMDAETLGFFY